MAMTQRTRLLASLAGAVVVAGGLGAYAFWGIFEEEKLQEQKKSSEEQLLSFDRAKVQKLTVVAKGATTVLERRGDGWRILSPVSADGDRAVVEAILDRVLTARRKAIVQEDGAAVAQKYGLGSPRISVTVSGEGLDAALEIGADSTFDAALFARASGSPRIVTVEGTLKAIVEKSTFDLREKRLLAFEDKDVKSLHVQGPAFAYSLARDEAGRWRLTSPIVDRADEATVNRLLASIKGLRAVAVGAEPPVDQKKFGLDQPTLLIDVTLASGTTLPLQIADQLEKSWAQVGDSAVAEVSHTFSRELDKPVMELRDRTVAGFDKELVEQVKLVGPGSGSFVAERRREAREGSTTPDEKWTLLSPAVAPAQRWKLSAFLHSLSRLEGVEIVEEDAAELSRYGLEAPRRTAIVYGAGGEELARVLVGGSAGEGLVYVMPGESRRVSVVESKKIDEWPASAEDVEDKQPQAAGSPDAGTPG